MTGPTVTSTSTDGRRRMTESQRAAMSERERARFAALPAAEQEAIRERMRGYSRARAKPSPPSPAPPPARTGGPRNPLDDAPRARPSADRSSEGRTNGHVAPPRFIVPDLPPLEPAAEPELEGLEPGPAELEGFTVDPAQVADLLSMPFDFVADRRGDHWRLRPLERERIAAAMARKINEHAAVARALDAGGDWILIFGGLAVVISTRLAEDARHADEPDPNARPGLAGIRLPGRPGSGRGAPPAAARPGPGPVQLDGARAGFGTLNGFGTDASEGDSPLAPEAQGFPTQSLG